MIDILSKKVAFYEMLLHLHMLVYPTHDARYRP